MRLPLKYFIRLVLAIISGAPVLSSVAINPNPNLNPNPNPSLLQNATRCVPSCRRAERHVPGARDQALLMLVSLTFVQLGCEPDWLAVPLQPGQVAVLGGHTLEFATAGALRATRHHVVVRHSPATGGQDQHTLGVMCVSRFLADCRSALQQWRGQAGLPPAGMLQNPMRRYTEYSDASLICSGH